MAKIISKNISVKLKITILSIVTILFLFSILFIFSNNKKNLNQKKQYLTQVYLKKNNINYKIQFLINKFIVYNHISYEKLEDFIDIQNSFAQTSDSINYYIKQYSFITSTYKESVLVDKLNSEYQKFQNIVYDIFSEYKKEDINLKNIIRIFDNETASYDNIISIINKLRKSNNLVFNKNINQIEKSSQNLRLYAFIDLFLFLAIFSFLLYAFFGNDIKSNFTLQKLLKKLTSGDFLNEEEISQSIVNTSLLSYIKQLNDKNKKINFLITELKNKNYNISLEKKYDKNDQIFASITDLSQELIESEKEIEVRKKEDKQKEWANKGYNIFSDIMRRYSNELNKLSDEIIKNFVKYLDALVGGLFIVKSNEDYPFLELLAAYAYDRKKYYTKRIEFGEGLIGTVATDQSMVILNDIPEEYIEIEAGLGNATPNSLLLIPLLTDNGLMGVIEIASFKPLEKYEIEFAETLSKSIASTLESVKINEKTIELLKESQKKSDELAQREKALQETMQEVSKAHETARRNEIEMRGILSGVDQTLMRAEYMPDGTFLNSNMVHRRVMGYDVEKMKGKNILEFIQDEEKESFKLMWAEVASGKPYQITVKRKNKQTDAELWLLNQYTPIKDDKGNVIKILYLAIDITEQKQAEEKANLLLKEAREAETEIKGILSGIDRTILRAEYSPEGIFIDANEIHTKILGYDKKEMTGKSILEFIEGQEEKENFQNFWKEIQRGKAKELTVKRINKSTNKDIWLINQYNPILDEQGKLIKILYLAIDITEQKLSEERASKLLNETKEKELELRGLFTAVDQTLMRAEYTPDGIFINANEIHQLTLGYNMEKMKGKNILEFIKDEEKNEFLKIWNNVRKGSLEQLTVKRQNIQTGEDIWLLNQYTPIEDETGKIIRILYLAIDITEQKKIEQKAHDLLLETQTKELQLSGILKGIDTTILRASYSPNGDFIDSNDLHTKTLGYDKEDMRGKNIREFVQEAEIEKFNKIWNTVKNGNNAQITVKRINKKTGKEIWLLNQYTPVLDTNGNIFRILYLAIDITEQKYAEEMARKLLLETQTKEHQLNAIISAVDNTLMRARYKIDGTFIDSNSIHQQIMGYKLDDMIEQNIRNFIPEKEKDEFENIWTKVINGEAQKITVKRTNKISGEEIFLMNNYTPIKNDKEEITEVLYFGIDVTEEKKLEESSKKLLEEAKSREAELSGILSGIDKTVLRAEYTPEGNFINANKIHQQIIGYDKNTMIGKNILEFISENEQEEFKKIWESIKKGEHKELTVKRLNKSTNEDIWLINHYSPILDENGKISKILYLAIDITAQKKLEQELIVQEKIMNQNMQELFKEYQKLEEENNRLSKIEKDIEKQFDTETDKLYNNWLNSFE